VARTTRLDGALAWLNGPEDAAGLRAFRTLFGGVMVFAVLRFLAYDWDQSLLAGPTFHFSYPGFDWVDPLPAPWLEVQFGVMALAAVAVMVGFHPRKAAALFALLFTWAELIDAATYLNHYYLISLLATLLALLPTPAGFSDRHGSVVPRWATLCLRVQVGIVYVYAGLWKLDGDWLLRAEPLRTWLQAYAHVPVVGPLLDSDLAAHAMSLFGAAFDLTIPFWLSWRRARPAAYAVAVAFHVTIWLLFPVGVFSWVMLASATIFFDPSWPRALYTPLAERPVSVPHPRPTRTWILGLVALWLAVQVLVPARSLLYPGKTNWTEEGFRFAWRVMLVEKTGYVVFRVRSRRPDGRTTERRVYPSALLTPLQLRQMPTQPDLIHQLARHIREDAEAAGETDVTVYADAFVSWNGRPSARLIDPTVDLAAQLRTVGPAPWILPAP
jgi:hypothetical protein